MKLKAIVLVAAFAICVPLDAARLPRTVIPHHYELTVTPNLAGERFAGEVVIDAGVQQPITEIQLNAAEIEFRSATIEGGGTSQPAKIAVDAKNESVTLTVAKPLAVGPIAIRIAYDGILNRQLRGFYIGQSNGKKYLASQMEALDARRAFPGFDEPDLKATFRLTVVADNGLDVISNTSIESETPAAAGKRTVRFRVTPRLSTYHIALVVGEFPCISDTAEGIPLRVCAAPDKIGMTQVAMEATKDLVAYFNRYFGIPYPFEKLDQIAIPDFGSGAMENPGAIIYRERVLLADPKTASTDTTRSGISTISHEIAHMWFGNLVTMRWWDDIWLNEGFASWSGRKGVEAVRPQWKRAAADVTSAAMPMRTDMLVAARQIRKNAEAPEEIDQLFDGIAYGKTAAVLRMVENWIGEEAFRSGINLYLRRHSFSNASSGEFAGALSEVGGREVGEVIASYVNQPGVPLVTVNSRCEGDATVVELQQQRFLSSGTRTPAIEAQFWSVPVCFTGGDCVVLRERAQTFRLRGCRTSLAANAHGRGYYLTDYAPERVRALTAKGALSAAERVALVRDQWLLARAGRRSVADFLDLAVAFGPDRETADEVLSAFPTLERFIVEPSQRAAFQRWLRDWTTPLLRDLGWTPRPNESPDDRTLRNTVLSVLGQNAGDAETLQRAGQLARQWLRKRESLDPAVVREVTQLAALRGDAALYDSYLRGYQSAADPTEKNRFLHLLSEFSDPRLIQRTLDLTLTDTVRTQDVASVLASIVANPAATDAAWKFFRDNWAALERRMVPGHAGRVIAAMGTASCDPSRIEEVKRFVEENKLTAARQATSLAIERISGCVALRTAQQPRLSEWIAARAAVQR